MNVLRGETLGAGRRVAIVASRFNELVIAAEAARGISEVGRTTGVPCIFEVLATDDLAQALARAGGEHGNKGWEAAGSALEMASLMRSLPARAGAG